MIPRDRSSGYQSQGVRVAQSSRVFPLFSLKEPDPEPTFYLGGQPYTHHGEEPIPSNLADLAISETAQQYKRLVVLYHAGQPIPEEGRVMSQSEWQWRATEMMLGLTALSAYAAPLLPHTRRILRTFGLAASYLTGVVVSVDV